MKSRQNYANLIEVIAKFPLGLSSAELAKEVGRSYRSVQRELLDLVQQKKIVKTGAAKATRYRASSLLPIGYQQQFLREFIPNKNLLLSQREKEALYLLGKKQGETLELETYSAQIYERLIVDLSWASSKLEGNTYSILETERLIQENLMAEGRDSIETQMILNHKEAIKFIIMNRKEVDLNSYTIRNVHALLSESLLRNPLAAGSIRQIPVGIEGTRYIPIDSPQILQQEFDLFLKKVQLIKDPMEQALFVLIFLPYLQIFEDLNKRTSRICSNISLIKNNFLPVSYVNIDTKEYIEALKDVYEYNETKKIKDLFLKAYQYSAEQYRLVKAKLQSPDPIAVKYRNFIKETVRECVSKAKQLRLSVLKGKVEKKDLKRVYEIISSELENIHEGNLARFALKPSDLKKWKASRKK